MKKVVTRETGMRLSGIKAINSDRTALAILALLTVMISILGRL
jgi:tRNA(Phe) wybutosine-synthesizing methylase Tyw3